MRSLQLLFVPHRMSSARSKQVGSEKRNVSGKLLPSLTKTKTLSSSLKHIGARELRAFRQIFDDFDLNKTGTITADELHVCLNQIAGYDALSVAQMMELLSDMDVKGTGDIEFDEFIYFLTRPQVPPPHLSLQSIVAFLFRI